MFSFDELYEPYPIPAEDLKLGCSYSSSTDSADFRIWAPDADRVTLQFFSPGNTQIESSQPLMYISGSGVWQTNTPVKDCLGKAYTFLVTRHGHAHECLDPYAKAMEPTRVKPDRVLHSSGRGIVIDHAAVKAAQPVRTLERSIDHAQAIIYEIHVRDFTIGAGTAAKPGTLAAFRERIPYLQELGITHVQLLPVLKTAFIDELMQDYEHSGRTHGNNYNWGYDPQNYFAINGWLTQDPLNPAAGIRELRALVDALHAAGIGVILDVVYNHMGDARFLEDILPGYYFRRGLDGKLTNNSGCGNDLATCRKMTRRLITDSLVYLAETFGVDGFRFDLMGLIDSETILCAKEHVQRAVRRNDLLFYGEGWRMYNGPESTRAMDQDFMGDTDEVAVFNDEFRDLIKAGGLAEEGNGFVTNLPIDTKLLYHNLMGDPRQNFRAISPRNSVNYIAAHDGLTLRDSIAHNASLDPHIPAERDSLRRRILMANFLLLTSQGIVFLHAGQERGRSKHVPCHQEKCIGNYVRDSYNSDDRVNEFVWNLDEFCSELLRYTKALIALRRSLPVFAIGDCEQLNTRSLFLPGDSAHALGYALRDESGVYLLLANAGGVPATVEFTADLCSWILPDMHRTVLADAYRVEPNGVSRPEGLLLLSNAATLEPLSWAMVKLSL